MQKMFKKGLAVVAGGLLAVSAQATPAWTYGFTVDSYNCFTTECGAEQAFFTSKLESLTLELTAQAVQDGHAQIAITTGFDHYPDVFTKVRDFNAGFQSFDASAWDLQTDLAQGMCRSSYRCNVEADLGVAALLSGLLRLDTSNDNVFMTASSTGLWSGYINSDGPYMTFGNEHRPFFTGAWQLVQPVSEPGTALLLGAALLALGVARRRNTDCVGVPSLLA